MHTILSSFSLLLPRFRIVSYQVNLPNQFFLCTVQITPIVIEKCYPHFCSSSNKISWQENAMLLDIFCEKSWHTNYQLGQFSKLFCCNFMCDYDITYKLEELRTKIPNIFYISCERIVCGPLLRHPLVTANIYC